MSTAIVLIVFTVFAIYIVLDHIYNTPPDEDETDTGNLFRAELDKKDYNKELIHKLEQQNKQLNKININLGCLTCFIVIPIILYFIIKLIKFVVAYDILQDIFQNIL